MVSRDSAVPRAPLPCLKKPRHWSGRQLSGQDKGLVPIYLLGVSGEVGNFDFGGKIFRFKKIGN